VCVCVRVSLGLLLLLFWVLGLLLLFFVPPPLSEDDSLFCASASVRSGVSVVRSGVSDQEYQIRSIRSGDATLFCASASVRR